VAQASYDQNAADFQALQGPCTQGFIGPAEARSPRRALKTARAQLDQAKAQSDVQGNQALCRVARRRERCHHGVDIEPAWSSPPARRCCAWLTTARATWLFLGAEDKVSLVKALAAKPGRFQGALWGADAQLLPASIREISAAADLGDANFPDQGRHRQHGRQRLRLGQTATVLMNCRRLRA